MAPSDPDFPYELEALELLVSLNPDYPKSLPTFCVLNGNIPQDLKQKISADIEDRAIFYKNQLMLRPMLNWIDSNMERLLSPKPVSSVRIIRFETPPSNSDTTSALASEQDTTAAALDAQDSEEMSQSSVTDSSETDIDVDMAELTVDKSSTDSSNPAHRGTQILCTLVNFEGVGVAQCLALKLTVKCSRCSHPTDTMLNATTLVSFECGKCKSSAAVRFRPSFIHQQSPTIGYVDTEQCVAFDILPSTYKVSCAECSVWTTVKGLPLMHRWSQSCTECHHRLELQFGSASFVILKAAQSLLPASAGLRVKRKKDKAFTFVVGQPLPDNGTCKHYKRSYRWLRFPCCGKPYPCDVCHEDAKPDGHEMQVSSTSAFVSMWLY